MKVLLAAAAFCAATLTLAAGCGDTETEDSATASRPKYGPPTPTKIDTGPTAADVADAERQIRKSMNLKMRRQSRELDIFPSRAGRVRCVTEKVGGKAAVCVVTVRVETGAGMAYDEDWQITVSGDLTRAYQWTADRRADELRARLEIIA